MTAIIKVDAALGRISARHTLQVPDFTLARGEHWCLFGGNGAGKTLFSRLLRGDLAAGRSHVQYLDGFDPRRDICTVSFEEQQKLWSLESRHDISEYSDTAVDQGTTVAALILGDKPEGEGGGEFRALVEALALTDYLQRGIRFLSSGQVRRAMIAMALYRKPRLLILDDPLESIDLASCGRIAAVLEDWMSSRDRSTLLLCRRPRDLLRGITHIACMEGLALGTQGRQGDVIKSEQWRRIVGRQPVLPESLPPALPGHLTPPLAPGVALIELRGINAGYQGRLVLRDFSWTLQQGQHTLIEGPNGSGKSTLLSLIDGENHMAYGQEVSLFGRRRGSGESVWDIKARFGVVSNELHNRYVRGWRVLDVVVSGFFASVGLYDDSGASEVETARAWLRTLSIDHLARDYYHELSFGQQRLVLLARAMVKHPAILVLDEPCVGLDDYHREMILGVVDIIAATTRTQIIFVSHEQGEVPQCINQRITLRAAGQSI